MKQLRDLDFKNKKIIITKNLGFVVIDEQHKFGVKQRSELAKKVEIIVMYY